MIIQLLHDYKRGEKFIKISKNDTHYRYVGSKYDVDILYHSSMFYAPEFYKVSVSNKTGGQIWSGGETMFLDSLFRSDFVSDDYDRMILTRVNSTESPNHMQIIMIDLKTGKEHVLTEEGHFFHAGHFISFDGIYYANNGVHCINYVNNSKFLLHGILNKHFKNITTWGACAVKDCIVVITGDMKNNVYLFDLIKQVVKDSTTLQLGTADSINITIGHVMADANAIISVSYSDRQASGALKHRETERYKLEF